MHLNFLSHGPSLPRVIGFQFIQIIYWLALSTWFGSVIFIMLAAPTIFRTVRESNPVLTNVLSVNLEGQHATLLAGSIVGNLLARLSIVQLSCAGVILICTILQFFTADMQGMNRWVAILRLVLCVAAAGVVAYDRFVIWPRITKSRTEYIDHADEPEVANPAKDRFDAEHRRSMTLMMITLGLLLLLIMYSANVQPAAPAGTAPAPAVEGAK